MRKHLFKGEDPILVWDFLIRSVPEDATQEMGEAQESIALPSFQAGLPRVSAKSVLR